VATSYCSRCGSPLAPNAAFCANCGAAIVAPAAGPGPRTTPPTPPAAPPQPTYGTLPYASSDALIEPEERPTGAGILTIVGGLFILLGGIAELSIGSAVSAITLGQGGGVLEGLGALGILMGILILVLGIAILTAYESAAAYGVAVIILSVISLASFFGGFVIGFILALIGGILATTWEPLEV